MKIIRAKVLGYCMGVRRAVETAEKSIASSASEGNKKVYTLGPLIHNPLVLSRLEEMGVSVVNAADNFSSLNQDSVVVIRAHGTTPSVLQRLETTGAKILDATCPKVHLSQKRAAKCLSEGYTLYIAGDRNHGEVTSISGFDDDKAVVIENAEEASNCKVESKAVLLAQTTFSPVEFDKIVNIFKEKNPSVIVYNSICSATMERQSALSELLKSCDGIIVIGGKNSANTRRLYERSLKECKNVCLIENETEIPPEFFSLEVIGLTAGASTPDFIIDRVEQRLKEVL